MTPTQWFPFGVLASVSFAVAAQPMSAKHNPLDPNATVPVGSYQSAFATFQTHSGEQMHSPDIVWRNANDELARTTADGSHAIPAAAPPQPAVKAPLTDHSKHRTGAEKTK